MYSILKGVRVVEGSAFIAAPMAGLSLAQLGADVIRFDPIGGGIDYARMPLAKHSGRSLYWAGLNKGKRSLAVNLSRPEGRELITALIARPGSKSGILLTNFARVRWLDYELLKKHRADVIKLEISGNHDGSTALDYTVNCALGYPYVTGSGSREAPVNHVLPAWDVACAMQAALGIASALIHRLESGNGQYIRLALSDVALAVVGHLGHIAEAQINGEERQSLGNHVYGAIGRDFGTADDHRISVVAVSLKQWQSLCEALGITEAMQSLELALGLNFLLESDRFEARDLICEAIAAWCKRRNLTEIARLFDANGICWGRYQSFRELVDHDPRASIANPMFSDVHHPGIGSYLTPGSPLRFVDEQHLPAAAAPLVGQHTEEVLADVLGYSSAQIGKLMDQGIVAGAATP